MTLAIQSQPRPRRIAGPKAVRVPLGTSARLATPTAIVVDARATRRHQLSALLAPLCTVRAAFRRITDVWENEKDVASTLLFLAADATTTDLDVTVARLAALGCRTIVMHSDEGLARQAFEWGASDYLVVPATSERLRRCIARVESEAGSSASASERPDHGTVPYLECVRVRVGAKSVFVKAAEIEWVEADGNYARLHVNGRYFVVRETLSGLEEQLSPTRFARVHRSALVGLAQVKEMESYFTHDYLLRLRSGAVVRMSRRYRREFDARMRAFVG